MAKLELELHRENREVEVLRLDANRVLIGSEAHCDVRLRADEAAPEQAVVQVNGQVVQVTARTLSPGLTLDGKRATRGTVASGGTLGLGRVTIRIWVDRGGGAGATRNASLFARPLVVLPCAGALLALGALLFLTPGAAGKKKPEVPELWTKTSASCPTSNAGEALATASEKRALAEAKAQRHPFIAREGVDAVQLYRVAAECASLGGDREEARALLASADVLRKAIDVDFRVRRLRLEYSLKIGDKRTAESEAAMLRGLLRSDDSPYVRWLATLERKLAASNRGGVLANLEGAAK
jgi:hypothetical protein